RRVTRRRAEDARRPRPALTARAQRWSIPLRSGPPSHETGSGPAAHPLEGMLDTATRRPKAIEGRSRAPGPAAWPGRDTRRRHHMGMHPGRRRWRLTRICSLALLGVAGLAWAGVADAQSAAQRAVDAAKKICAGRTVTIVWEAGLQSLDPLNF